MKIVLESVDFGNDRPIARLYVQCGGDQVATIQLPVEGVGADVSAIAERLRDFSDCLVEWTRQGTGLVSPAGEV